jgi:UDP-N-acetylmuramoyl-tripeptide--D-alanyl-D-alanine ligase
VNFDDPFTGYSALLRTSVYVVVPAVTVLQFIRLRRALHVYQLEGYRRTRFLEWTRAHRDRARWLSPATSKKPLVMTGRAWRILVTATLLVPVLILVPAGIAHVWLGGWPVDVIVWAVATGLVVILTSHVLVAADLLLRPVQAAINRSYLRRAQRTLADVSPVVIGVTGSFGKTSTKFAIERFLDDALATPGSFNTPLGVCRTINEELAATHRFFVVEMGAYGVGEIAELCRFVRPSIGVLTAIGPAHLERFGSIDAVRRAKYELIESLPDDGVAVMNVDDPIVRELADSTRGVQIVRYGLDGGGRPDITATGVRVGADGSSFTIEDRRTGGAVDVETRLLGRYAIGHVLAGAAVALSAGRALADLRSAISELTAVEHRLQLIAGAGGVTVIDDAYNSNPDGAAAALEVLEAIPGKNKVVVSPGIIELGSEQVAANQRFGRRAAEVADYLIVVAKLNRDAITSGASQASNGAQVVTVDTLDDATTKLQTILGPGDVVLFENDLPDQYEG